jgi:hypothetical protein
VSRGTAEECSYSLGIHLSDPVVEEAMRDITSWIYRPHPHQLGNWRHQKGLRDPSSRAAVIHAFKHLKHHRRLFDPAELREWARANGWTLDDATEMSTYAEGVQAGNRYHTAPDPFGPPTYFRWSEKASKPT